MCHMQRTLRFCLSLLIFIFSSNILLADDISFHLQFHNQRVYYPHDEVWIRATVRNVSARDYTFSLANQAEHNISLVVRTLTNQVIPVSEGYMLRIASNEPVFYRIIKLLPEEEYSFLIKINDFVDINDPGNFILQAQFNPSINNSRQLLTSNALRLSIRPSSNASHFLDAIDAETGEILELQALSPDEIIQFVLKGRQLNQWNKVFLYLNLEALFQRNSERRTHYLNASESIREELLKSFKEQIKIGIIEANLAIAPDEFEIIQVSYTPTHAKVVTRQIYYQRQFNEVKQFIWNLEKNNGIWLITNFSIQNLGTQ